MANVHFRIMTSVSIVGMQKKVNNIVDTWRNNSDFNQNFAIVL